VAGGVALAFTVVSKDPKTWAKATGTFDGVSAVAINYDNGTADTGTLSSDGTTITWSNPSNVWARYQSPGLELFFSLAFVNTSGGTAHVDSFWPQIYASSKTITLNAEQIAGCAGGVGVVASSSLPPSASSADEQIECRVGFSLLSLEQARANVTATTGTSGTAAVSLASSQTQSFDELVSAAWRIW
jgi:hypothetical protein